MFGERERPLMPAQFALRVAILSGLKEGEKVVTGPVRVLKKLHDGDQVEVTTEKKTSDTKPDKEK